MPPRARGCCDRTVYLAFGQIRLKKFERARQSLREGLEIVQKLRTAFLRPELIAGVVLLRLNYGEWQQCAVLVGLVEICPNLHIVTKTFVLPSSRKTLATKLDQPALFDAIEQGKSLDIDQTLVVLLKILADESQ